MSQKNSVVLPNWLASYRHPVFIVSLLAVVVTAIIVCGILSSYSVEKIRNEKRERIVELRDSARALILASSQGLLKSLMVTYEHQLISPDTTSALESSEFKAVGSFVQDDQSRWSADLFFSRSAQFEKSFFSRIERQVQLANVRPGELTWARATNDNGQVIFAVLSFVQVKTGDALKNKVIVGLSSQPLLAQLGTITKGGATQMFVVDKEGYTYSYPEAQYVGAKIDTHPAVRALMNESTLLAVENFTGLDGQPIFATSDWVPDTNLAVVVTTPRVASRELTMQYIAHTLMVVIGLIFLLMLAVGYLISRDVRERDLLVKNIQLINRTSTPSVEAGATTQGDLSTNSVENFALKEIVKAIVDYMRMPMSAILGQLQIATQQDSPVVIKDTLSPAISDVRKVRDFVENLCRETELIETKKEVVEVLPILNHVISNYRSEISKHDIIFEENFKADFSVRGDIERVRSSISTLLLFAIEFLSNPSGTATNGPKRLVVNLEKLAGLGQINIEGYGRAMKPDEKRRLFEPFKTKLRLGTQFGLELVLAQARIEEMQGESFVENIGVDGFRILVRFATATRVTADQVAELSTAAEGAAVQKSVEVESLLASKKLDGEAATFLPPEPSVKNALATSVEATKSDDFKVAELPVVIAAHGDGDLRATTQDRDGQFQIRKPKVRLDL